MPAARRPVQAASALFDSDGMNPTRASVMLVIFLVLAGFLAIKLVLLQVVDAAENSESASVHRTSDETVYAHRGTIYDRNGNVLARTVDVKDVYVSSDLLYDREATAAMLASITGKTADEYLEIIPVVSVTGKLSEMVSEISKADKQAYEDYAASLESERNWTRVESKLDMSVAQAIEDKADEIDESNQAAYEAQVKAAEEQGLDTSDIEMAQNPLDCVYFEDNVKRIYPYGRVAGQIIGYVGADNYGLSGLESYYDDILSGTDGRKVVEYGKGGIPMPGGTKVDEPAVDGQDIKISIDIALQQYAENTLESYATQSSANSADITIIDGATGEIYACASTPLYDLNNVSDAAEGASNLKSISGTYEPGSVFKSVTMATLLEAGLIDLDEVITVPGSLQYGQWTITDADNHTNTLYLTAKEILAKSSNIGISILEDRLSTESFYAALLTYGFGEKTGVDYPGEATGLLSDSSEWAEVTEANISFGQGISVTSLQMASFYGMIAAGGSYVQPHFLISYPQSDESVSYESSRMLSEGTCDTLTDMLCSVVSDGTGASASVEGYNVAGKTGTSQKITDSGTYAQGAYVIDFCGFLADTNSTLACVVSMDNPTQSSAMPVFSSVMDYAADLYRVVNDE